MKSGRRIIDPNQKVTTGHAYRVEEMFGYDDACHYGFKNKESVIDGLLPMREDDSLVQVNNVMHYAPLFFHMRHCYGSPLVERVQRHIDVEKTATALYTIAAFMINKGLAYKSDDKFSLDRYPELVGLENSPEAAKPYLTAYREIPKLKTLTSINWINHWEHQTLCYAFLVKIALDHLNIAFFETILIESTVHDVRSSVSGRLMSLPDGSTIDETFGLNLMAWYVLSNESKFTKTPDILTSAKRLLLSIPDISQAFYAEVVYLNNLQDTFVTVDVVRQYLKELMSCKDICKFFSREPAVKSSCICM